MSKWEENYNNYSERYNELKEKFEDAEYKSKSDAKRIEFKTNQITKEEYDSYRENEKKEREEFKKLDSIKDNVPQVANLLHYRDNIDNEINHLNQRIANIKEIAKFKEEQNKLEEEVSQDMKRYESYRGLKPQFVQDKLNRIQELKDKQNSLNETGTLEDIEFINAKIQGLEVTRNKCNYFCNLLMQGKNIDEITLGAEVTWKNREFRGNEETAKKIKMYRESKRLELINGDKNTENKENENKENENKENGNKENGSKENEGTSLVEISDFQKEFPRLAKRLPFLKNNLGRLLVKFKKMIGRGEEDLIVDDTISEIPTEENEEPKKPVSKSKDDKKEAWKEYVEYDLDFDKISAIAKEGAANVRAEELKNKVNNRVEDYGQEAANRMNARVDKGYEAGRYDNAIISNGNIQKNEEDGER